MWVIQQDSLVRLPDDAPMPPGSVKIDVPEEFHRNPYAFAIKDNKLVRLPELQRVAAAKLTTDDVTRIKKAIAEGRL